MNVLQTWITMEWDRLSNLPKNGNAPLQFVLITVACGDKPDASRLRLKDGDQTSSQQEEVWVALLGVALYGLRAVDFFWLNLFWKIPNPIAAPAHTITASPTSKSMNITIRIMERKTESPYKTDLASCWVNVKVISCSAALLTVLSGEVAPPSATPVCFCVTAFIAIKALWSWQHWTYRIMHAAIGDFGCVWMFI